ncbi:hypothetical protein CCYA_CCYA01G0295 [Cyanidiococcus yangmingshanensis]|nr:hypothetical protein CCYA_CCYA01G0295 [Cyanidiococcus yangmingshanensis]
MKYGHRLRAFSEVFDGSDRAQRGGPSGVGAASASRGPAASTQPLHDGGVTRRGASVGVSEDSGRESSAGYETSASSGGGSVSQRSLSPVPVDEHSSEGAPQIQDLVVGPRAPPSQLADLRTELCERYRSLYAMYKSGKSAVRCIRAALEAHPCKARTRSAAAPGVSGRRARHLQTLARTLNTSQVPLALERVFDGVWSFFDAILREIAALLELFTERTADLEDRLMRLRALGSSGGVRSALELGAEAEQVLVCLQIGQVAIGKILKKFIKVLAWIDVSDAEGDSSSASVDRSHQGAADGFGASESGYSSTTTTARSSGTCADAESAIHVIGGSRSAEPARPMGHVALHLRQTVHLAMRTSLAAAMAVEVPEDASLFELVTQLRRYLVHQPFVCDHKRLSFLVELRHRKDCAVLALYRASKRAGLPTSRAGSSGPCGEVSSGAAMDSEASTEKRNERALGALSLLRLVLDGNAPSCAPESAARVNSAAVRPSARVRPFVEECRIMARELEVELASGEATWDPASPYEVATRFYLANTTSSEPATTIEAVYRAARAVPLYFVCPICLDMLFETTELACRHRFCTPCVMEARFSAEVQGARFRCPLCQADMARRHCCDPVDMENATAASRASVVDDSGTSVAMESKSVVETTSLTRSSERRAVSVDELLRAAFPDQWRLRERQMRSMRSLLEQRRRFRERLKQLDADKSRSGGPESRSKPSVSICGCLGERPRSKPQSLPSRRMPMAPEIDDAVSVAETKPNLASSAGEEVALHPLRDRERPRSGCSVV